MCRTPLGPTYVDRRSCNRFLERPAAVLACALTLVVVLGGASPGQEMQFETESLATELTVGYAVRLLDMNDDETLDIVVLDSKRMFWLENPSWEMHLIHETPEAKFDNVCFAPADIDGDGDIDFAVGADWQFGNTQSGGSIGWLQQGTDNWSYHPITTEPTTHRMQWISLRGQERPTLVVAPLKGRGTTGPEFDEAGVRLLALSIPSDPVSDPWPQTVITDQLHVMHNLDVVTLDRDGQPELLTASFEGVHWIRNQGDQWQLVRLGSGETERPSPGRGSSEVRLGQTGEAGPVIATIEPWHGDTVVTYTPPPATDRAEGNRPESLWQRHVLDEQLAWGHAVAFADLDGDPAQELIIGVRDNVSETQRSGVRIYDPVDPAEGRWNRSLVDPGGVAVEDLAVGDLDGDGRIDIVAVGRQTHNIRIYWNRSPQR